MDVVLDQKPPCSAPNHSCYLAMVRPRVFKRVLTQVSAMGIKRIILINSYRVEKSFLEEPGAGNRQLEQISDYGA